MTITKYNPLLIVGSLNMVRVCSNPTMRPQLVSNISNMNVGFKNRYWKTKIFIILLSTFQNGCYEKTLRKIVRNQSKMVQRPFTESNDDLNWKNHSQTRAFVYPGYAQVKSVIHKMQRPKISTILSSVDTGRNKAMFSRVNIGQYEILHPYDLRMARDAITDVLQRNEDNSIVAAVSAYELANMSNLEDIGAKSVPKSNYFPPVDEKGTSQSMEQDTPMKDIPAVISDKSITNDNNSILVRSTIVTNTNNTIHSAIDIHDSHLNEHTQNVTVSGYYDTDIGEADFYYENISSTADSTNTSFFNTLFPCTDFNEVKTDIDAQEKFSVFNIEPPWIANKQFWNQMYESRYESLMRDPRWPALKVILVPRMHLESIWKDPFDNLHRDSVRKIVSNVVKKLQFYTNLTFSWNEVSHLSEWWKSARQKSRTALRKLVAEGRLEITTGGWVETDEATSHIFGMLHQLIEGHQWLHYNLNYSPNVGWLTTSVTHSPTWSYFLSASGVSNLILTNLHFSWQQYLTEYQYTDFVWVQNWDTDRTVDTCLNKDSNKIGNDRYPKHSVLTHYLQFNSAGFEACGPQGHICDTEFNFANPSNNQDINTFNVKEKSEKLLEQYSKTGTTSSHNVVISPLSGRHSYESQTEFDFQYNNYQKIADYLNINNKIYKATVEFGTGKDYFKNVLKRHTTSFPTLKGDFLNFADIVDGTPAYWTGYFTSRPLFKILLRRLHSTLRSTEILFSFALKYNAFKSYDVSKLYERLFNARESVARLQDRNVVGGALSSKALRNAQHQILITARDCWYIQETAASLLGAKSPHNETYLEKYLFKEGEFVSSFKSVTPGDQIYVFNSLNHHRVEIVELITRHPSVSIVDHNKREVSTQVNPVWKFGFQNVIRISSQFFKITFVISAPPLALLLFKIKENNDAKHNAATIYCNSCVIDELDIGPIFTFDVRPLEPGDIQLENHKHRLICDEHTGFLKTVTQKSNNRERSIVVEFGAFKIVNAHSGMFLFNTNISNPLEDILLPFRVNAKLRSIIIISGQITTELSSIYGNLLHHTVKIFNVMNNPLADVIKLETKVDYDATPENREIEMFLSIQTDISNGDPPELFTDNNGFQYTARTINANRRVESNMYPFTSMVYIQDQKTRLTIITDYAQGVTALQEGQLVIMLDRRGLFDDNRGSNEGIADNRATSHTHYILLENFFKPKSNYGQTLSKSDVKLPSQTSLHLANTLNYYLDIYFIDTNRTYLCHYAFMPLVKISFPCDVMLINYRAVLNRGVPDKYIANTALMTLHRQSFCCLLESDNNLQCSRDSSLKLKNMFRNVRAVYQTNLVGTNEGASVDILNKHNFPPMELTTLRIFFY